MTKRPKPPHSKPSKKSRLRQEDIDLWKAQTQDVKRAKGKDYIETPTETAAPLDQVDSRSHRQIIRQKPPAKPAPPTPPKAVSKRDFGLHHLDKKTAQSLKKGQIRPEAVLDLHGLTQEQAHSALIHFVHTAARTHKRCLLVITGKGTERLSTNLTDRSAPPKHWSDPKPGILKRRLPDWLSAPTLAPHILTLCPAHAKDGGTGAFYLYLRRNKTL